MYDLFHIPCSFVSANEDDVTFLVMITWSTMFIMFLQIVANKEQNRQQMAKARARYNDVEVSKRVCFGLMDAC